MRHLDSAQFGLVWRAELAHADRYKQATALILCTTSGPASHVNLHLPHAPLRYDQCKIGQDHYALFSHSDEIHPASDALICYLKQHGIGVTALGGVRYDGTNYALKDLESTVAESIRIAREKHAESQGKLILAPLPLGLITRRDTLIHYT